MRPLLTAVVLTTQYTTLMPDAVAMVQSAQEQTSVKSNASYSRMKHVAESYWQHACSSLLQICRQNLWAAAGCDEVELDQIVHMPAESAQARTVAVGCCTGSSLDTWPNSRNSLHPLLPEPGCNHDTASGLFMLRSLTKESTWDLHHTSAAPTREPLMTATMCLSENLTGNRAISNPADTAPAWDGNKPVCEVPQCAADKTHPNGIGNIQPCGANAIKART